MKAPDITSTQTGKQIVNIMAKGVLRYMQEHQIPVTKEGYESVVEHSKESGLNGKIAFLDSESKREIIELLSKTTG